MITTSRQPTINVKYYYPFVFHPCIYSGICSATAGHQLDQRQRRLQQVTARSYVEYQVYGYVTQCTVFNGYFTQTRTRFKHEVTAAAELVCHTKPKRKNPI